MFDVNFNTSELQFPCHPRYQEAAEQIKTQLSALGLTNHFIVLSSGTTGPDLKGYALSREALFENARAVNEHFSLSSQDVWGLSIPYFHVGGLSVLARAHVLKSKLVDLGTWSPVSWHKKLFLENVSITTLVPTQVYDLVKLKLKAPLSIKQIIIGGDYLGQELAQWARDLGWPIIRTFGMTEVSSQLASGNSKAPDDLKVLPIHEIKVNEDQRLLVKGRSLFTLQFKMKDKLEIKFAKDFCDEDGYYITNDLARVEGNSLHPLGRIDDQIKLGGKLVSLNELKDRLTSFSLENNLFGQVEVKVENDERRGKKIVLLHLPGVEKIQDDLFYPHKVELREVSSFERTDLGKLKSF